MFVAQKFCQPVEFEECDSILSFCPLSVTFNPHWQCFWWCDILNNTVGLFYLSPRFTLLDKKFLPRSFLDNPKSILGFWWNRWRDLWVICLMSSKSPLCDWIHGTSDFSQALAKGCLFFSNYQWRSWNLEMLLIYLNLSQSTLATLWSLLFL